MMKRIQIITVALMLLSLHLYAAPVDIKKAREKAATFMAAMGMSSGEMSLAKAAPRKTPMASDDAAYYVFNATENDGFVIISGDDRTEEVLGYATNGMFDEQTMPATVKAWLQGYADQIDALNSQSPTASAKAEKQNMVVRKATPQKTAIAPMLKTEWNQDEPYNNLCPEYETGEKAATGCVATAIAQIMYYNRWPEGQTKGIPYFRTETHNIFMPYLQPTTFAWDKMPLNADGKDVDNAVATLMLYVGQASKMDYDAASGTTSTEAVNALTTYFNYDGNATVRNRDEYTIDQWHDIVYGELAEGRPVYYSGSSDGGGHAFVCDGYDGKGLWHINWGWGGSYDGYFRLEVLNPYGSGIGGSSTSGGFSFYQDCITGLVKPTGKPADPLYMTAYELGISNNTLKCEIYNVNPKTSTFDVAWGVMDDNGKITKVISKFTENVELEHNYGWGNMTLPLSQVSLQTGVHKIVPVSKESASTVWKSALPSYNYAEVTVDTTGQKTCRIVPTVDLKATTFTWPEHIIQRRSCSVEVEVKNNGDEYNGILYMFTSRYSYSIGSRASIEGAYIKKGESDIVVMHPQFTQSGTYYVKIATDYNGSNIIGETTVNVIAGPQYDSNLQVVFNTKKQNGSEATFTLMIKNNSTENYIDGFYIYEYGGPTTESSIPPIGDKFYDIFMEPGQTITINHLMTGLKVNWAYAIRCLAVKNSNAWEWMVLADSDFVVVTPAGIDGVETDSNEDNAPYYTLSGVKVDKPVKKGIYIHKGKKIVY